MSFLLDVPLLLICGAIAVYICVRFLYKKTKTRIWLPLLYIIILATFWAIAIALYLDYINMPLPGDQKYGKGNHFMWNSGCELIGLGPFVDTSTPTYLEPFGFMNILAVILFALYPLWLYLGVHIGYILFGRTEKQTGIVGLL